MTTKDVLLVLAFVSVVSVHVVLVSAGPPDWVPPELIEMVQDDKQRCMSEHGTTQEQIDKVNEGILINEPSVSCYMYCLLDAFSLADEDGNLESEMMISFLPENLQAQGTELLNKCAKQDGADNCEKIFNVAKCVQNAVPELWFMV